MVQDKISQKVMAKKIVNPWMNFAFDRREIKWGPGKGICFQKRIKKGGEK
jgi:hypothetical protein